MKYSTYIDNITAHKWGLNLSQATLFDWITSLPSWADQSTINGKVYFFASRHKACDELPTLTDKPDTIYRYYKSLEEKGLIELQKIGGKDYLRMTEKCKDWGRGNISEHSEKNPSDLGKKSELDSENFPTDYNISIDKKTIDKSIGEYDYSLFPSDEKKVVDRKSEKAEVPTLEQVKDYFKKNEYTEAAAEKAFSYYQIPMEETGGRVWKDSKGITVKNWRQKMRGVWFKDENKIGNNGKQHSGSTWQLAPTTVDFKGAGKFEDFQP